MGSLTITGELLPHGPAAAFVLTDDQVQTVGEGAFTHRKEFARWIDEAKRDETRSRRVAKAIEMLHAGQTRS